jgi:hypothetical protein
LRAYIISQLESDDENIPEAFLELWIKLSDDEALQPFLGNIFEAKNVSEFSKLQKAKLLEIAIFHQQNVGTSEEINVSNKHSRYAHREPLIREDSPTSVTFSPRLENPSLKETPALQSNAVRRGYVKLDPIVTSSINNTSSELKKIKKALQDTKAAPSNATLRLPPIKPK